MIAKMAITKVTSMTLIASSLLLASLLFLHSINEAVCYIIDDDRVRNLDVSPVLGRGYNVMTNTFQSTCMEVEETTVPSYNYDYSFYEFTSPAKSTSNGDGTLSYSLGYNFIQSTIKHTDTATMSTNTDTFKHHIVASMRIERYYSSVKDEDSQLSPDALTLLANQDYIAFFKSCGASYVRGIRRAQEVLAIISFESTSSEDSHTFAESVMVGGWQQQQQQQSQQQQTVDTQIELNTGTFRSIKSSSMVIHIKGYGLGLHVTGSESLLATTLQEFRQVMIFAFRTMTTMTTIQDAAQYGIGMVYGMEINPWVNDIKFQTAAGIHDAVVEIPLEKSLIPMAFYIDYPDLTPTFDLPLDRSLYRCTNAGYVMDKFGYCCQSNTLYDYDRQEYDSSNPELRSCRPIRQIDSFMAKENLSSNGEFIAKLGHVLRYKTDQLQLLTRCISAARAHPSHYDFHYVKPIGKHRTSSSGLMFTLFELKVALDPLNDYGMVKQMGIELEEFIEMFYTPCITALYRSDAPGSTFNQVSNNLMAYPWYKYDQCTKLACLGNGMRWDRKVGGCVPGLMAGTNAADYNSADDTSTESYCQKDTNDQLGPVETCKHNSTVLDDYQSKVKRCFKGNPSVARVDYFLDNFCLPDLSDQKLDTRFESTIRQNFEIYCSNQGQVEKSMNVALRKPASQSTVYIDKNFKHLASLAVDGNRDGRIWRKSLAMTRYDTDAWWSVDLQQDYVIKNIVIYNRQDCCLDRLSNFKIVLLDDDVEVWSQIFEGVMGPSETFDLESDGVDKVGDQVKIILEGQTEHLQLAEVEVFNKFYV